MTCRCTLQHLPRSGLWSTPLSTNLSQQAHGIVHYTSYRSCVSHTGFLRPFSPTLCTVVEYSSSNRSHFRIQEQTLQMSSENIIRTTNIAASPRIIDMCTHRAIQTTCLGGHDMTFTNAYLQYDSFNKRIGIWSSFEY